MNLLSLVHKPSVVKKGRIKSWFLFSLFWHHLNVVLTEKFALYYGDLHRPDI